MILTVVTSTALTVEWSLEPEPERSRIRILHFYAVVEASHAYAHARAIAFFSYIWFKYDILSLNCCKLGGIVVGMLNYQPSAPGFNSWMGSECVMQYAGTRKEMHKAIFFLLQNLALQLGLGQECQPEGIAILYQQLFNLRMRHTITLECGSLRKFCTTSSSFMPEPKWSRSDN